MHIWVDADACPKVIRDILFRAAERTETPLTLVANQFLATPPNPNINSLQVASGFDVADDEIVRRCHDGDIVITADIPLAAEVIEKGALVISPRGEAFTKENIRGRLNVRDFMDTLRSSGINTGGPPALSQADRQSFANLLDKTLAKAMRQQQIKQRQTKPE